MKFGDHNLLVYSFWVVPLMFLFYLWALKKHDRALKAFADDTLLADIVPFYKKDHKNLRMFLNISAVFLILVSLARPQWGFYWKEDRGKGLDIMFAVDVSRSMLANDVKPTRLGFAQEELADFIKKLKGDRLGLIAFSGEAFLQCPLTADHGGFLLAVKDLDTDTIPTGGTSIPDAVEESVRAYKGAETASKVLIIVTDGENTEGNLKKAVELAKKQDISISCIGIGSKEGQVIKVKDETGKEVLVKDKHGRVVKSRLMEDALKEIALKTGGIYVKADGADLGLDEIYDKRLAGIEKKETKDRKVKVYKERFQWPLSLAALFLIMEIMLTGGGMFGKND